MPYDEERGINVALDDGEPVFLGKDKIGYVYECGTGYGAVAYNSEMGHEGIDSKAEAIQDVIDMHTQSIAYGKAMQEVEGEKIEQISKKKIFWLYAYFRWKVCDESGFDLEELEDTLRSQAKEAGIRWSSFLYKKHWTWLEENLK